MSTKTIKVGYLVSYDWKLLENSIPRIYNESDVIVLALDKNRLTWAGNRFEFDKAQFDEFITKIDFKKKIEIYEDDFYDPSQTTMQNEVRERNMLADKLQPGGWHIQLDADEYPIDFPSFIKTLKKIDPNPNPSKIRKPVNVSGNLITIIKKVPGGYIYVKPNIKNSEQCILATQIPHYENGRRNGYFNIQTTMLIIHESRSRSNEEFYFKLKNWGHNQDFNIDSYYEMWKAIDGYNYKFIKDFNPIGKNSWPELCFAPAQNVSELIDHITNRTSFEPSFLSRYIKNSRNIARLRALAGRFL